MNNIAVTLRKKKLTLNSKKKNTINIVHGVEKRANCL